MATRDTTVIYYRLGYVICCVMCIGIHQTIPETTTAGSTTNTNTGPSDADSRARGETPDSNTVAETDDQPPSGVSYQPYGNSEPDPGGRGDDKLGLDLAHTLQTRRETREREATTPPARRKNNE